MPHPVIRIQNPNPNRKKPGPDIQHHNPKIRKTSAGDKTCRGFFIYSQSAGRQTSKGTNYNRRGRKKLPFHSLIRIKHSLVSCHNDEILHPDRIIHLPMELFRAVGVQDDRAAFLGSGGYQNRAVNKNCDTRRKIIS